MQRQNKDNNYFKPKMPIYAVSMAKTLQQLRKRLRKANRSGGGIDEFFVNQEKASRAFDRSMNANKAYEKAKKISIAKSRIRTPTQARKIFLEQQKARAELDAFFREHPINTPEKMRALLKDAKLNERRKELTAAKDKAEANAELAKLIFPKTFKQRK